MKALRRALRRRIRWGSPSLGGLVRAASVLSVAFIAILATPAVAYYQEPGLNGIASTLAGRKVEIRCYTKAEQAEIQYFNEYKAQGYVEWKTLGGKKWAVPVAHFRAGHCKRLQRLAAGNLEGVVWHEMAWSLMVLMHETGHMVGKKWSFSEPRTQCWAMKQYERTLAMFGYTDPDFLRAMWHSLTYIHLYEIPIFYQLQTCKLPEAP